MMCEEQEDDQVKNETTNSPPIKIDDDRWDLEHLWYYFVG